MTQKTTLAAVLMLALTLSFSAGAAPIPAPGGQQEASRQAPSEDGWRPAVTPPAATPRPAEPPASKRADEGMGEAGKVIWATLLTMAVQVAVCAVTSGAICVIPVSF